MSNATTIAEQLTAALREYGIDDYANQALHSWRCSYDDNLNDPCDHFAVMVADIALRLTAQPDLRAAAQRYSDLRFSFDNYPLTQDEMRYFADEMDEALADLRTALTHPQEPKP